jgi:hypothetical protein
VSDDCGQNPCVCGQSPTDQCDETHKQYATPVGGERMSEARLATWERSVRGVKMGLRQGNGPRPDVPADKLDTLYHNNSRVAVLAAALRAERAYATGLERKPLDGYDWRADLERIEQMRGCCVTSDGQTAHTRLAAYIEALEAR